GAAVCSGCGTLMNTAYFTPHEGGERVYGGVRGDWDLAVSRENHPTWVTAAAVADLPLSAVGDTLALPYLLALALTAEQPAEPKVRKNQLLNESFTSGQSIEPVDGWRPSKANTRSAGLTYERLDGAIG